METVRLQLENLPASNGKQAVTRLEGKLSLETVSNFLQSMRPEASPHLILDMSGVTFLDSAGVGALVQLFVHRRNSGQSFALAALTPQGTAVMQVSGLLKLMPVFPSVSEAAAQHA